MPTKAQKKAIDDEFARFIKDRAGWRCCTCHRPFVVGSVNLHASHFVNRRAISVRFDGDNVDPHCLNCHTRLHSFPKLHYRWKRRQLGLDRFEQLLKRSQQLRRFSDELIQAVRSFIEANRTQREWSKEQEVLYEEEPF